MRMIEGMNSTMTYVRTLVNVTMYHPQHNNSSSNNNNNKKKLRWRKILNT
jgi:hypothetical protein